MAQVLENVRQALVQLLPAYIINDVKCYVFHDNHPRCDKKIDITVYTKSGEVREYYQRDLLSYVTLETTVYNEMRILRNSQGELFYLLAGGGELTILSRKEKLEIHETLIQVLSYEINDPSCTGEALLKIISQNSAYPLVPDDNYEQFEPVDFNASKVSTNSRTSVLTSPITTHLMRKLIAARTIFKSNEKSIRDFLKIRQKVALSIYKRIHPNLEESLFRDGLEGIANLLKLHPFKPWIKCANKKIVFVYDICNGNKEPLEDIHILLHGSQSESIDYSTKIFEKTNSPPFWNEVQSQILAPGKESAIVLVIDLDEVKDHAQSRIELHGLIVYMKSGKEGLLPTAKISLSSMETMGAQFDALSNDLTDENNMLVALATTAKTDLILRHLKEPSELPITIDKFCEYLKMERVPNTHNIAIHRASPYHVLNGVIVIFGTEGNEISKRMGLTVHSRSLSQILAFIHLVQDAVPLKIIITMSNYRITAKTDVFSSYSEDLNDSEREFNYMKYASTMLNRSRLALEYLDNCMIKMSESNDATITNKIGSEIDLFAQGEESYLEFKTTMRCEVAKGVEPEEEVTLVPLSDDV